jgi:hypothetical protein
MAGSNVSPDSGGGGRMFKGGGGGMFKDGGGGRDKGGGGSVNEGGGGKVGAIPPAKLFENPLLPRFRLSRLGGGGKYPLFTFVVVIFDEN